MRESSDRERDGCLYDCLRPPRRGGLRRPDQSDQSSSFERVVHNLGSTWFVISKQVAVQIHNSLKRHLLGGDKLAVVQCGNRGARSGFNDEASGWLNDALK